MNQMQWKPSQIVVVASAAVLLVASFLTFYEFGGDSESAWGTGFFPLFTLPAIAGILAAVVTVLLQGRESRRILGISPTEAVVTLGAYALVLMLCFLVSDAGGADRGIGLWLSLLASIALVVGAFMWMREAEQPAAGGAPPTP